MLWGLRVSGLGHCCCPMREHTCCIVLQPSVLEPTVPALRLYPTTGCDLRRPVVSNMRTAGLTISKRGRIRATVVTCSAAMAACEVAGCWEEALQLFGFLLKESVQANQILGLHLAVQCSGGVSA